jgi:hypothetical protein
MAFFALPGRARGASLAPTVGASATVRDLAEAVLPPALGPAGLDAAVKQFEEWIQNYKAGAEMSSGYGFTRLRVEPPDPSAHYAAQLKQLHDAALARGASFAESSQAVRRELVRDALNAAHVEGIPRRPDGAHVATDLMAFFFFISSDGHDFLYDAAIHRDACRGLKSSGLRPAPLH